MSQEPNQKIAELIERFSNFPKYLHKGAGHLAKRFKCTKEEINEARRVVRQGVSLAEYCRINNIDKESIRKVKAWQNFKGEQRYSVDFVPVENSLQDFKKALLTSIGEYELPKHTKTALVKSNYLAVINLYDAHIDKVCLFSETHSESSLQDNIDTFTRAFDTLLNQALLYSPEVIVFPIGNDFLNTNGSMNTTKKGTPQAVGVDHKDAFIQGIKLLRNCIDKASQYSNVVIKKIAGNHDEDSMFYVNEVLSVLYENHPNVLVDPIDRTARKYYEYGVNLLGFAHGDREVRNIANLPLLMAEEAKEAWARTTFREWFLGDKHHKFEYKFMRTKDFVGSTVRFLRSVGTSDKWHHDNGYIGVPKTAELFVYHKQNGPAGNFTIHI